MKDYRKPGSIVYIVGPIGFVIGSTVTKFWIDQDGEPTYYLNGVEGSLKEEQLYGDLRTALAERDRRFKKYYDKKE